MANQGMLTKCTFAIVLCAILALSTLAGCSQQESGQSAEQSSATSSSESANDMASNAASAEEEDTEATATATANEQSSSQDAQGREQGRVSNMKITVNGREFTATLEDNATTKALEGVLPLTVPMDNLYSREMCYHLPDALPTDDVATRGYEVGDLVYWPPMHSLVILYAQNGEHFSYQKLGHVEGDVESFFTGAGTLDVTFSD